MSDKMSLYYEAYFGTPIPASQVSNIQKPFLNMVGTLKADIMNYLPHASDPEVKSRYS